MAIEIKYATTADAQNIAVLSRQTFYDTFAEFNAAGDMEKFMSESFSNEALMAEVGLPAHTFFTAFMEGDLVGYAKLTDNNPPGMDGINALEIGRIYVTRNTIGSGVGKKLMEQCITTATERKKQLIWLGVWEHNQRAISFYQKFGFEKFGAHDFLLGNDVQTDWLMRKSI